MTKYKLEYIWLDGYKPVPNLRGKTQIKDFDTFPSLEDLPLWGFDGSSTKQAEGHSSDCVLKPVAIYPDSERKNGVLVMCEVMMPDGVTPHPSTSAPPFSTIRAPGSASSRSISSTRTAVRSAFPPPAIRRRRGPTTPASATRTSAIRAQDRRRAPRPLSRGGHQPRGHQRRGREGPVGIPDLRQGLQERGRRNVDGALSVAAPDREIRDRHRVALQAARRYGLERFGHARQFLDEILREVGGKEYFEKLMAAFYAAREEHIAVYGPDNHMRLTGQHETAVDRRVHLRSGGSGASIRVPHSFVNNGYKGYLEDRRPNSQGDPYQIASQILKTIATAPLPAAAKAAAAGRSLRRRRRLALDSWMHQGLTLSLQLGAVPRRRHAFGAPLTSSPWGWWRGPRRRRTDRAIARSGRPKT